jgi:uncharacterized membrane protein
MTNIRFVGNLPWLVGLLLAAAAALVAWWLYRRERHDLPGRLRWALPALRAGAVFLAVLTLTGPVLHHRQVIGQLGRVLVFLDGSQSMAVADQHMPVARKLLVARDQGWLSEGQRLLPAGDPVVAAALRQFDKSSRWTRALNQVLDPERGLLAQLSSTHELQLVLLTDSEGKAIWDSGGAAPQPTELEEQPAGQLTDLAGPLVSRTSELRGASASGAASAGPPTAIVLVTDGRHNADSSPLDVARTLGSRGLPVYCLGFGSSQEPPDLAVLEVECPDMVFQKDHVRGTLVLKDQMPAGRSFLVQVGAGDTILWQKELTSQQVPVRRVDFEFRIDSLVEQLGRSFDTEVRHHAVSVPLEVSIGALEGETDVSNNTRQTRLMAITQSYRLLLLDGRSRWETRYLRNAFQRDEQWKVDTVLAGPSTDQQVLPRGEAPGTFPDRRARLMEYDLIVLGELPGDLLQESEWQWIHQFVQRRGGGVVLIDGQRGHLRQMAEGPAGALLPVDWLDRPLDVLPDRLQLTESGSTRPWLMLQPTEVANRQFWDQLPAPHRIVPVEALPGTEVLVETAVGQTLYPTIVTRSFGAGRVLYFAFDETWRWRYKVADAYHQRFWNQAARWVMPKPFAVSDSYVSLDAGAAAYAAGQRAEMRVRLRQADGRPAENTPVDALLWRDGQLDSVVALAPDPAGHGLYRGRSEALEPGQYEIGVRAAGFSNDALKARTSFVVHRPPPVERQYLGCDAGLLRQVAAASGGQFLREEQSEQLKGLLRPLSRGRVRQSDTLLWQSYWWLLAIVGLLGSEWFMRKRAGLL